MCDRESVGSETPYYDYDDAVDCMWYHLAESMNNTTASDDDK